MSENQLVSVQELADLIADSAVTVFDCRFDLRHPEQGRNTWLAAHIPGAVYTHLDDNLAGRISAQSGRHPLPFPRSFAAFLARSGWTPDKRVVAYDAHGGAFATRFWWLMKYFGLGATSLLDGGIGAWRAAGMQMESGPVRTTRQPIPAVTPHPEMTLNVQGVLISLENEEIQLLDARAERRFNGLEEPIDTVAGHIPGALNHPFERNLLNGTHFRSSAELKSLFRHALGKKDPSRIVHMCGSGVTACHNLFAMELCGIEGARVYVGSWSEWIRDPARPVVRGSSS